MKRAKLISAELQPIRVILEASSDADIGAAVWNLLSGLDLHPEHLVLRCRVVVSRKRGAR